MFISSVLIAGAYQAYRYTMTSANREKLKAELQSDIMTVCNIIEKDIRMAGCGLPGNGLTADLSDPANPVLKIFSNQNGTETTLDTLLQPAHFWAIVADTAGFSTLGGICIASEGVDTIYRTVIKIGHSSSGSDTVYFYPAANTSTYFSTGTTRVFATDYNKYSFTGTAPDKALVSRRNGLSVPIGKDIDSMRVTLKNSNGTSVGSIKDAAMLSILMGGYIGNGGNRVFLGESTEVNIRNSF